MNLDDIAVYISLTFLLFQVSVGSDVSALLPPSYRDKLALGTSLRGLHRLTQLEQENSTLISLKVKFCIDHFLEHRRKYSRPELAYFPKALFVTSSRRLVLRYKREFDAQLALLPEERFQVVAAFSAYEDDAGESYKETNATINGVWATYKATFCAETDGPVAAFVERPEIQIAIVAEKLRTGFDFAALGALYVDTVLGESACVQTLSRLSRICPGKERVQVLRLSRALFRSSSPYLLFLQFFLPSFLFSPTSHPFSSPLPRPPLFPFIHLPWLTVSARLSTFTTLLRACLARSPSSGT